MLFTPVRRGFDFDLFDDFFEAPFWSVQPARHASASHAQGSLPMKTDIKEENGNYVLDMELPGFKKEDIKAELKNGYLTVSAVHEDNKEEKNEDGKVIRKERYSGSCNRSFYVGENLSQEDIHAAFENGILKLQFPKDAPKQVEAAPKYIQITD